MCGRTACTLHAESVTRACEYKAASGKRCQTAWQSRKNAEKEYVPSYNVAPTDVTPCIVAGSHFENDDERVLFPMIWGMIPPWHKGDYNKHGLSTHNCRLESVSTSKLYASPLSRGRRCVVICDGYYEWKKTEPKATGYKQPYFVYAKQKECVKIEDPSTWSDKWSVEGGWTGIKLLKIAGLFNTWTSPEGETIYSYAMLTMEANKVLSWLHHRTPVFLETEEDVTAWLDYVNVTSKDALAKLHAPTEGALQWHPVDTMMNNSRCKSADCNKPIKLKEKKKSPLVGAGFMASWLKRETVTSTKRKSGDLEKDDDKDCHEPKAKHEKTN